MKPQDIIFIIALIFLIWRKNPRWFAIAGYFCLIISLPLFARWVFFTAERLVYYAAFFLLLAIIFLIMRSRNS